MAKTVTMRKGDSFADIFDSPETIAQAKNDGYHLCSEAEVEAREALNKARSGNSNKKQDDDAAGATSNSEQGDNKVNDELNFNPHGSTSFNDMSRDDLLKFAGKNKIYNKSFKELEKDELIKKINEAIKAKVVEAGLKTAEEAEGLAENDLFELFNSIGK